MTGPATLGLYIDALGTEWTTDESGPVLPAAGGSPILQYELQYDDGARGPYKSVYTLSPLVAISQGVQRGLDHRVRYRARNFNGWGVFSEVAYITAAGPPVKPGPPVYLGLSASDSEISVALSPTPDDRGAVVTAYTLQIDEVQLAPSFEDLPPSGLTMTRTIAVPPPATATEAEKTDWLTAHPSEAALTTALVRGRQYRLRTVATNIVNGIESHSEPSEELRIALGRLPGQPSAPLKVEAASSMSSLMMAWTQPVEGDIDEIEITGYSLYMDDGYHGEFSAIYDGRGYPEAYQFLATNLTTGLPYRFAVTAHNLNGESTRSASLVSTVYACLLPSELPAP